MLIVSVHPLFCSLIWEMSVYYGHSTILFDEIKHFEILKANPHIYTVYLDRKREKKTCLPFSSKGTLKKQNKGQLQ